MSQQNPHEKGKDKENYRVIHSNDPGWNLEKNRIKKNRPWNSGQMKRCCELHLFRVEGRFHGPPYCYLQLCHGKTAHGVWWKNGAMHMGWSTRYWVNSSAIWIIKYWHRYPQKYGYPYTPSPI